MRRLFLSATVVVLALGAWPARTSSDSPGDDDTARRMLAKLQQALERNPRRGTTWERVFQTHLVRGSVEEWVAGYRARVAKDPRDGVAWMLLGLIESRRGHDDEAARAFREAETHRPADPLASFYLGEALAQTGRPGAVEALERAVARKPQRDDLLAVFRALGRAHQRAHEPRKALAVWDRLEKLLPEDFGVQEQIAAALVEEGQFAEALKRFESLARNSPDRAQRPIYRLDAADLKVRLERKDDAVADYEALLGELAPGHWLHREVLFRLEDVFLRNEDHAGLARYYEARVKKKPDDVEAMERLARVLRQLGRPDDARAWLTKALQRAPGNKPLRLALIEQLTAERGFAEAARQYAELDRREPNQPDVLGAWGQVLLRDDKRAEAERRRAAEGVWRRVADARPNDPQAATQAAELFRQADMTDEALEFYRRAVKLAPADPQFRENLGEYYHALRRPKEAQLAWQGLADGKERTVANLARLAEIYANHEYLPEALRALADACSLDKGDFFLHLKYAALLERAGKPADALRQAEVASGLARGPEDRESALRQEIACLQSSGQLAARIAGLRKQVEAAKGATAEQWYRLARHHESAQERIAAVDAIEKALALDPKAIPALATSARVHESAGDLQAAADANRKLASLDRRARTEYLVAVARLEGRMGRTAEALAAGRELLLASPGNLGHHQFFAELCFQLGAEKEGLDALRLAVRNNPNDPAALGALAKALADRFRAAEAIELYWKAFRGSTRLDDKLGAVGRLAELYAQKNDLDSFFNLLRPRRGDPAAQREQVLCLAEAYRAAGDLPRARKELDRLLTGDANDRPLLQRLSVLAEAEGNQAAAVAYQRQVVQLTPEGQAKPARVRLAMLLLGAGEAGEARDLFLRVATAEHDPRELLLATQHFLARGRHADARQILPRVLEKYPDQWEALYLDGLALAAGGQLAEAAKRFQAILALSLPEDQLGIVHGRPAKQAGQPADHPVRDRLELATNRIAPLVGLPNVTHIIYQQPAVPTFWSPADYGQARVAALAQLLRQARRDRREEAFVEPLRKARDPGGKNARAWWDWLYLQVLRGQSADVCETARVLSRGPGPAGKWLYLMTLQLRELPAKDAPLPPAEVDHVVACYRALCQGQPDWLEPTAMYNVWTELNRARREKEVEPLVRESARAATGASMLRYLVLGALERGDVATVAKLEDRLADLRQASAFGGLSSVFGNQIQVYQALRSRADANAHDDLLKVVDHRLGALSRRPPAPAAGGGGSGPGQGLQIAAPMGTNSWTSRSLLYPLPNEHLDADAIILLRLTYDLHLRDGLWDDLIAHFRARVARAEAAEQARLRLALCYLRWWNNDRAGAVRELTAACQAAPTDVNLRFELARLHEQQGQLKEALVALDAIPLLNSDVTRRREVSALRLATKTNNKPRARQASERLFGLQLDTRTQLDLADELERLGLKDEARSVLTRARRQQADPATLAELLSRLEKHKQADAAAQVAVQILRATAQLPPAAANRYVPPQEKAARDARDQAVRWLGGSGKLKELIAQAEANAKALPRSTSVQTTLLEFYQAAGDRAKVRQTYETLARLNPNDPAFLFRVGQHLTQAGAAAEAVAHFEAALKVNPQLMLNDAANVVQAYRQAKQVPELGKVLEGVDQIFLSNFEVRQLVSTLLSHEDTKAVGWGMFRKTWAEAPYLHSTLLSSMSPNQFEAMPGFEEFARRSLLLDPAGEMTNPWFGVTDADTHFRYDVNSDPFPVALLEALRRRNKLEGLTKEIEEAVRKRPAWKGGKALLAFLHLRHNRLEEGRKALADLLADAKAPPPHGLSRMLAREAEKHDSLTEATIRLYELGLDERNFGFSRFDQEGVPRLLKLYQKAGRHAEGRAFCLKLTKDKATPEAWDYDIQQQQRLAAADYLLNVGYPIDAMKVYQRLLHDPPGQRPGFAGGATSTWRQQAEAGFRKAPGALNARTLPGTIQTLLAPGDEPAGASRV
jgi:tetratricopeptide (TPR) repeat protein